MTAITFFKRGKYWRGGIIYKCYQCPMIIEFFYPMVTNTVTVSVLLYSLQLQSWWLNTFLFWRRHLRNHSLVSPGDIGSISAWVDGTLVIPLFLPVGRFTISYFHSFVPRVLTHIALLPPCFYFLSSSGIIGLMSMDFCRALNVSWIGVFLSVILSEHSAYLDAFLKN